MSACAQCGAQFSCGMVDEKDGDGAAPCWCTELPPLMGVPGEGTCLCPTCLRESLRQLQEGRDQPGAL